MNMNMFGARGDVVMVIEKQLNSEIAVNRLLPSSEKIGRTSSKNENLKEK